MTEQTKKIERDDTEPRYPFVWPSVAIADKPTVKVTPAIFIRIARRKAMKRRD